MCCKFNWSLACLLHDDNIAFMCRVRKSHSDTALSGLERDSADKSSALAAFKADGLPGASSKQAVQPQTGLAEQPEAAAVPQVTLEAFGSFCYVNLLHADQLVVQLCCGLQEAVKCLFWCCVCYPGALVGRQQSLMLCVAD